MELPFLNAIILEGLRLYPPGIVSDRVCTTSFELAPTLPGQKPYTLKAGDMIWLPVAAISYDAQYFDEPKKFKPERFLDVKIPANQPPFMPFGVGPRSCIGNRFALLEMKIIMVHLLLRCNFSPCSRTNIPMEFAKDSLVFYSKGGFWLRVDPRSPSPIDMFKS